MAASGAPDRTKDHATNVVDVALELLSQVQSLVLPSDLKIEIRIGLTIYSVLSEIPCKLSNVLSMKFL